MDGRYYGEALKLLTLLKEEIKQRSAYIVDLNVLVPAELLHRFQDMFIGPESANYLVLFRAPRELKFTHVEEL